MKKYTLLLMIASICMITACSDSESSETSSSANSQVTFQYVIRAGATYCSEQKSILKVQAIERANNPYVQMPSDCEIAAYPIPIQVHSKNNLRLAVVFNSSGRAMVQEKDLEMVQVKN